jgi:hypothetical protein
MLLKVFVKLKKTLKTLSSRQKTQKKPKKPKKPKKNQKTHWAGFFLIKPGFFSNPALDPDPGRLFGPQNRFFRIPDPKPHISESLVTFLYLFKNKMTQVL